jgi:hypothetical protein
MVAVVGVCVDVVRIGCVFEGTLIRELGVLTCCVLGGEVMCACAGAAALSCSLHLLEVMPRALRPSSWAKRTCCNATSECFD